VRHNVRSTYSVGKEGGSRVFSPSARQILCGVGTQLVRYAFCVVGRHRVVGRYKAAVGVAIDCVHK
jgi:hypothetical protein